MAVRKFKCLVDDYHFYKKGSIYEYYEGLGDTRWGRGPRAIDFDPDNWEEIIEPIEPTPLDRIEGKLDELIKLLEEKL